MSLSKRDAALRSEATRRILTAHRRLDSGFSGAGGAFHNTLHDHPRNALRAIAAAEAHLAKAKRALRAWVRGTK